METRTTKRLLKPLYASKARSSDRKETRATETKPYFLPPTWDYSDDGPVQIGNIITSPDKPAESLNEKDQMPQIQDSHIQTTVETDVDCSFEETAVSSFNCWPAVPLKARIGGRRGSKYKLKHYYHFDSLETIEVEPTPEYLEKLVSDPGVVKYMERRCIHKTVYVITAIKIARGAKGQTVKHVKEKTEVTNFNGSSDYIFAFRLQKIKHSSGEITNSDYSKGAMYILTKPTESDKFIISGS